MSAPGVSRFPYRFAWPQLAAPVQPEFEQWGLSPAKLREVQAELNDHVLCLQREEGQPAAHAARERIAKPQTRRALAAPHLADQVYATLNRWPTRREWRELWTLLAWFALILLADRLAAWALPKFGDYRFMVYPPLPPPSTGNMLVEVSAWLLQAVARAGFFTALVLSLVRAWKIGGGVCLARVLQLKLIHTLLVAAALIGLGRFIWTEDFGGFGYTLPWPSWLTAPVILAAGCGLALLAVAMTRGRAWAPALGMTLAAVFMYPGGPIAVYESRITTPLAYTWEQHTGQPSTMILETDKAKIAEKAAKIRSYHWSDAEVDEAANRWTASIYYLKPVLGMYEDRGDYRVPWNRSHLDYDEMRQEREVGQWAVSGPLAAPGGGIGWLAVPIPIFGIIGFLGLLGVMGRRGKSDLGLYAVLCGFGLLANLMPFYAASEVTNSIFRLEPLALMTSPFVGFEYLLAEGVYYWDFMSVTLILGLLFSAAVPWVLAALFLKPAVQAPMAAQGGSWEEC